MKSTLITPLLFSLAVLAALACDDGAQPTARSTATPPATATGVATAPTPLQTPSETQAVPRVGPPLTQLPAGTEITEGGLYIYETDSRSIWKASFGYGWSWSPDGKLLAARARDTFGRYALYIVDVKANVSVRAYEAAAPSEEVSIQGTRWSPDGNSLAFLSGDEVVNVVNRDGTGLRDFRLAGVNRIKWLGDGNRLALELAPPSIDGPAEYAIVDVASGQISRVQDRETIDRIGPAAFFAEKSGDGAWLEVQEGIQNLRTGEIRSIPRLTYVSWAPAGQAFIYFEGNTGKLFSARFDGDQITELTNAGAGLVWSPDGQRIAYTSFSCDESDWDIYVSAADGSNERRLTFDPASMRHEIHWSPDGRKLIFAGSHVFPQDGERKGLLMLDIESTELTLIAAASETFADLHSEWSPSGRYIAFVTAGGHGFCH